MMLTRQDVRSLGLPLATLGTALVIAIGLYSYAGGQVSRARQQWLAQQSAWAQARAHRLASATEKENIARFLPEYRRLKQHGFIGEEKRASWMEHLREIHLRHQFSAIDYDIGIQQAYKPAGVAPEPFQLHRSVVTLRFPVLHEGRLLSLLQMLPTDDIAPFILRDCMLVRRAGEGGKTSASRIDATCSLDWLTVTEPLNRSTP